MDEQHIYPSDICESGVLLFLRVYHRLSSSCLTGLWGGLSEHLAGEGAPSTLTHFSRILFLMADVLTTSVDCGADLNENPIIPALGGICNLTISFLKA